jgi:hypothetical protein
MRDVKLADGTWATTAIWAGLADRRVPQCPECRWEDRGPPETGGPVPLQIQVCRNCGWVRGRYLGNPHPEADDDPAR